MRKTLLLIPLLTSSLSLGVELNNDERREAYAIGASVGEHLLNQIDGQEKLGVKTDKDIVLEGFLDAFKNQLKIKHDEVGKYLNNRVAKLNKAADDLDKVNLEKNLKAGKEYMAKNAKNKKVKTTKSGLQYEIITNGSGDTPRDESIVVVNYKAYLIDGTIFDDTTTSKTPAHLSMVNIIDGLGEGLKLMKAGSKYKFTIPSALAYGDHGMDAVPAGAVVIFEAELLRVLKPGELAGVAKELSEKEIKDFHGTQK
ncbi:MAG: FKBP-type peptidyl-prolyl cis-trans isomerase N-terminal domain-containing protein [Wolinella sp.]